MGEPRQAATGRVPQSADGIPPEYGLLASAGPKRQLVVVQGTCPQRLELWTILPARSVHLSRGPPLRMRRDNEWCVASHAESRLSSG